MSHRDLPIGTRVRLKAGVHTFSGWRGTATMLDGGTAIKDGATDRFGGLIDATREEWAVMRDQTPNPEHAAAVTECLNG